MKGAEFNDQLTDSDPWN